MARSQSHPALRPSWFPWWFLCVLPLMAVTTAHAADWWNRDWTLRRQITLDATAAGSAVAGQTGTVPVLVRLFDGNFQFAAAQPDGGDLRFVAADGKTLLNYHIEKYDNLLDEGFVWVRVPDLAPGTKTTIWMYYGYAGKSPAKVENAKGTYDEHTVLVYHFVENGQPAVDFSGHGNTATSAGLRVEGSLIGPGVLFNATNSIGLPDSPSLALAAGGTFTWSAWLKPAVVSANGVIYQRHDGDRSLTISLDHGVPIVTVESGRRRQSSPAGAAVAAGKWTNLAVVGDAARLTLYVDAVVYSTLEAPAPALGGPAVLGRAGPDTTGYSGELDELTISNVARPAAAIQLAVLSQGPEAKFLAFGDEEKQTNWLSGLKTGYFGIIIGSLSFDGWVVIGILGVMSLISWVVMVGKARYLNRISRGNERFLQQWRTVANNLSILDEGDARHAQTLGGRFDAKAEKVMRIAPLYRIYHIGAGEIQHRLGRGKTEGSKVLSAQSIQAIRASLDGGLVHEMQRLNSQMVLLTIAISGGPFLGLLGTVVGVMITFAAVAAAGEVNVNAIAPGIAAALAATVAGLAVAIPALFGYNYLVTRIKGTSNDMHVFIDEFVTKLAEFYSPPSG